MPPGVVVLVPQLVFPSQLKKLPHPDNNELDIIVAVPSTAANTLRVNAIHPSPLTRERIALARGITTLSQVSPASLDPDRRTHPNPNRLQQSRFLHAPIAIHAPTPGVTLEAAYLEHDRRPAFPISSFLLPALPYHLSLYAEFSDSIVLFILALLLFGPKRLPKLARELGKWVGEFRRASNEFKMQMDDELRLSEQADREKQIAAMAAAAPVTPVIPEPEHPHLPPASLEAVTLTATAEPDPPTPATPTYEIVDGVRTPVIPIATSGELKIMPPSTGLPQQRGRSALGGLLDAIPETDSTETAAHGD